MELLRACNLFIHVNMFLTEIQVILKAKSYRVRLENKSDDNGNIISFSAKLIGTKRELKSNELIYCTRKEGEFYSESA